MKKLTLRRYLWLKNNNLKKIWKIFKKNRSPRKAKNKYKIVIDYKDKYQKYIKFPEKIGLEDEESFSNLTTLILEIRKDIIKKKFHRIDFRPLKEITPSGALIIAAEIDRWRRKLKIQLYPWLYEEWDSSIRKIFLEFQLFKLLNVEENGEANDFDEITFLPFVFGQKVHGESIKELRMNLEKIIGKKLENKVWFIALSEAMTNVAQHAYRGIENDNIVIPDAWWLSGLYNQKKNELTVIFYDQGITIPKSLPQSKFWAKIMSHINLTGDEINDSKSIDYAFKIGQTRTNKPHRGRGIAQLLEPIKKCKSGHLKIISRKGFYLKYKDKKSELKNYGKELGGTLIEWTLAL